MSVTNMAISSSARLASRAVPHRASRPASQTESRLGRDAASHDGICVDPTPRSSERGSAGFRAGAAHKTTSGNPSAAVLDALHGTSHGARTAREAGGGTNESAAVTTVANPALKRLHERLRARRRLDARDVPQIATRTQAPVVEASPIEAALGGTEGVSAGGVSMERPDIGTERDAGLLSRFMRLRGRSGRAYVFSRIEPRHVALYRDGVFAWAPAGASRANVIGDVMPIVSRGVQDGTLYVHLLAEDEADRAAVVADLT